MKNVIAATAAALLVGTSAFAGSPTTVERWYQDRDMDGYGDPDTSVLADTQPAGYVGNALDCNDADANVFDACSVIVGNSNGTNVLIGLGALALLGAAMGGGSSNSTTGTN